jgi:Tfp pilus assembly protein PilX
MKRPRIRVQNRRGFALVLVVVTILVLLGFWAMAYRETASLIRVESSRLLNQTRAVQSIHAMTALDQALTLLEVSIPTNRQTYVYTCTVNVTPPAMFTVTFTPTPNNQLPGASNGWTVQVTPGSLTASHSLPSPGDVPQWPSSP